MFANYIGVFARAFIIHYLIIIYRASEHCMTVDPFVKSSKILYIQFDTQKPSAGKKVKPVLFVSHSSVLKKPSTLML